jgi:hypothetical protein
MVVTLERTHLQLTENGREPVDRRPLGGNSP